MQKNREGGYLGLIALMVTVAIIGLLYTKTYFTPQPSPTTDPFQPLSASGTPARTGFGEAHADVDAATAVQKKLNEHNAETNAALFE